jgi:regulator of replication initiation timing
MDAPGLGPGISVGDSTNQLGSAHDHGNCALCNEQEATIARLTREKADAEAQVIEAENEGNMRRLEAEHRNETLEGQIATLVAEARREQAEEIEALRGRLFFLVCSAHPGAERAKGLYCSNCGKPMTCRLSCTKEVPPDRR